MKKLNLILLALITVLTISCDEVKTGGDDIDCCVYISASTRILYQNNKSENLLTLPNGIKAADVKLYNVVNGKAEYVFNGMLDASTGVRQIKDQNGNDILDIMMNMAKEDFPVTLIKLSETDTDTIKTEYYRSKGTTVFTKVWYNGVLKWDGKAGVGNGVNGFVVVKN